MPFTYEYPRPAVTVDVALFTIRASQLAVLLIKRARAPFRGSWALPGGFVDEAESLEHAAARELHEETGLSGVRLEQLGAFGEPGRDPRGHTVSVAFLAFAVSTGRPVRGKLRAGDDAAAAQWHAVSSLALDPERSRGAVKLAFDHARIVSHALVRLRQEVGRLGPDTPLDFAPARFTMSELQLVHEAVVGHSVDKRNFRSRLLARGVALPVVAERRTGRHRPAQLYRWATPEEPAPEAAPRAKKPKPKRVR